jgi:hypothetical protein
MAPSAAPPRTRASDWRSTGDNVEWREAEGGQREVVNGLVCLEEAEKGSIYRVEARPWGAGQVMVDDGDTVAEGSWR